MIGLTRTLAFELGGDDITVNAICPGATRGPRIERVIEAQADRLVSPSRRRSAVCSPATPRSAS
ncbi:MAG: SDR family oxidoreductase [Halapricum sp.]